MAVIIQAGTAIAAGAPHLTSVEDPGTPTSELRHYQLWDKDGKEVGRYATNLTGEFVGGTILEGNIRIGYADLSAFVAILMLGRKK